MPKDNRNFFEKKKDWSEIKDTLLGAYLKPYFQKILMTRHPVFYVDCFSGKGRFDDGKPGSPIIALDVRKECMASTKSEKASIDMCFIDLNYASELEINLRAYEDSGWKPIIIPGKYEEKIIDILKNKRNYNVFLYIDPYGIQALDSELFDRFSMFAFASFEMLINFNSFGFFREACRVLKVDYTKDAALTDLDDLIEYSPIQVDSSPKSVELLNKIADGTYWQDIVNDFNAGRIDGYQAEERLSTCYKQQLQKRYTYVLDMPIQIKKTNHPRKMRMQKKTPDYDNVFKTMKMKHKRLFVSVINDVFGSKEIEEQVSDFLIRIGSEMYLLECQSYDDGSMAIRIAEYAFIVARQFATWDIGHATIPMPRFSIIYVKRTDRTPKTTTITFTFPDGQTVDYQSDNVILADFTKEKIVEKRLFPYIPFYIVRYEKEIASEGDIEKAVEELTYFRDEMVRLHQEGELSDDELVDLKGFVNTIITHITNGNKNEERLVNIMGGTIIETESERLIRLGRTQMIVELGQEDGLDDRAILKRLQEKIGLSKEEAEIYFKKYGKQLV